MRIGNSSEYHNLYSDYRVKEIPSPAENQSVRTKPPADQDQEVSSSQAGELTAGEDHNSLQSGRSKPVELEDISLIFHKEESYDYIGSESKLENLDMQKAISDMQKDKVLQEYQYFVGSSGQMENRNEHPDGIVLKKLGL